MQISHVHINLIQPRCGLIAFASVVLNDEIRLNGIGIHEKASGKGYRLTYPTRKPRSKTDYIFHPLSPETSVAIEQAVFVKLKTVLEGCHDRHDSTYAQRKRL